MQLQPKASHFIDGEYVEDTAGSPLDVIFPATGEVVARLHTATPDWDCCINRPIWPRSIF
jgi:betaine-aldehyde dehydrogenase